MLGDQAEGDVTASTIWVIPRVGRCTTESRNQGHKEEDPKPCGHDLADRRTFDVREGTRYHIATMHVGKESYRG